MRFPCVECAPNLPRAKREASYSTVSARSRKTAFCRFEPMTGFRARSSTIIFWKANEIQLFASPRYLRLESARHFQG
jgi:hypothetical protein